MRLTPALRDHYTKQYQAARVNPARAGQVQGFVNVVRANLNHYLAAADMLAQHGHHVPAGILMAIQCLEASGNLSKNIENGQPLSHRTTIAPVGRGPFARWEDSVLDSFLHIETGLVSIVPAWDVAGCLYFLECYNGTGYYNRNVESPYLWSYTQFYRSGKYVADGRFSPTAVSAQPGCVALIKTFVAAGLIPDLPTAAPALKLASVDEQAKVIYSLADRPMKQIA